jgi:hypothetical protein
MMDIETCQLAIQVVQVIRKYESFLKHNRERNFVSTELIATGRGKEDISFQIPFEYVVNLARERIEEEKGWLEAMGISYEEEDE